MSNIICYIIFGLLIIFGLTDLIVSTISHVFSIPIPAQTKLNADNIEYTIRASLFQKSENRQIYDPTDIENNTETKEIYRLLIKN